MPLQPKNTAVTTAGNGTLLASALIGGYITRTGPTGAFVDTTDTAQNILAALQMGQSAPAASWTLEYILGVNQTCTFTGGTGVTINGGASASISGNTVSKLLFTTSAAAGAASTVAVVILWTIAQP